MNIAVINIRDLIKYACFVSILIVMLITGVITIKNSSFLRCLSFQMPLMGANENIASIDEAKSSNSHKILDTQLAMLYNLSDELDGDTEIAKDIENNEINVEEIVKEEKSIEIAENVETKVISENNITASFTNTGANVQVKNQSKYNVDELLANSSYELNNKDKVVIYHTHTCESYTPSEKYGYEMTGSYRTTNLGYSVAKVRR